MLDDVGTDLSFLTTKRMKSGRPVIHENITPILKRKRYQHEKRNNSLKPARNLPRIKRSCIGYGVWGGERCGKEFIARGKFNRLCPRCKQWADENGY